MRLVRPLVVASLGLAVVGLLAACAGGGLDARLSGPGPVQEGGSIPTGGPGTGQTLPDSTFQRLDGGDTTFAAYRGKPLVVNVWASWCDPCLREMPEFEQVHQAMGDKVTFIGLNSNDLHDQAESMAAKTGVTYDLLFDPKASFVADTGVVAMPSTLFVDADGKVVATKSGALSADDLQGELHGALRRMIDGAFLYAFTTGMVAAVNPCGFAMLPAYLSYFLGLEGQAVDRSTPARLGRALVVSACVSLGFVAVFLGVGLLVNAGLQQVVDYAKWASIAIGVALVVLGIAILLGYRLPLTTPRLDKGGRTRSLGSMFLFGVSYAVASIGCTLPIFLAVLFGGITRDGFLSGVLGFLLYGLGMALVLTALTVTLAVAEGGLLRLLRHAMRWVDRLAGVLLILAGAYLVYYWTYNLRFQATLSTDGGGLAAWMEDQSAAASEWIAARPWSLALLFGLIAAGAAVTVLTLRRRGRGAPPVAAGPGAEVGPTEAAHPDDVLA